MRTEPDRKLAERLRRYAKGEVAIECGDLARAAVYLEHQADEIERLQAALKLARRVMRDFGLWKPGTPDTDQIRAALKP